MLALATRGIGVRKGTVGRGLGPLTVQKTTSGLALAALLAAGDLDARQGAVARAYRGLRVRYEAGLRAGRSARNGGSAVMNQEAWFALKRRHGAMVEAAGFDRFLLDRLLLDDDAPMRCEVGRIRAALGRVAAGTVAEGMGSAR